MAPGPEGVAELFLHEGLEALQSQLGFLDDPLLHACDLFRLLFGRLFHLKDPHFTVHPPEVLEVDARHGIALGVGAEGIPQQHFFSLLPAEANEAVTKFTFVKYLVIGRIQEVNLCVVALELKNHVLGPMEVRSCKVSELVPQLRLLRSEFLETDFPTVVTVQVLPEFQALLLSSGKLQLLETLVELLHINPVVLIFIEVPKPGSQSTGALGSQSQVFQLVHS
mmetsp:Transcript_43634/g.69245  ORF Transcript_43634/g.69245 Transcript_43634/m.69245 type:complete len:223 (+) Transcript_43634:1451-2119(+)